ncbi:MAG: hypothetical protein ACI32N_04255 [Bulleidia sp.]
MDFLINIILFAVALVMMLKVITLNKRNKKAKAVIDIVNSVDDEELFREKADAMIHGDDPEFAQKAKVLKLWGMAYHQAFRGFETLLNEIDVDALIRNRNGRADIEPDEDSFFYLYLAIPNLLEGAKRKDLRMMVDEKMKAYDQQLSSHFCNRLHEAVTKFYDHQDDRGLSFFEQVLAGDYGDYIYAKSMIGLYKSIATTHAGVLYKEAGNTEKYEECLPYIENFCEYGVGKRWLKVLKITLPKKNVEDEDTETFRITQESAKQAQSEDNG